MMLSYKKIINVLLQKLKSITMCYIMLLEGREKAEAINILHFKIACGTKKLLIFNNFCLRYMSRNMDNV